MNGKRGELSSRRANAPSASTPTGLSRRRFRRVLINKRGGNGIESKAERESSLAQLRLRPPLLSCDCHLVSTNLLFTRTTDDSALSLSPLRHSPSLPSPKMSNLAPFIPTAEMVPHLLDLRGKITGSKRFIISWLAVVWFDTVNTKSRSLSREWAETDVRIRMVLSSWRLYPTNGCSGNLVGLPSKSFSCSSTFRRTTSAFTDLLGTDNLPSHDSVAGSRLACRLSWLLSSTRPFLLVSTRLCPLRKVEKS